MIAESILQSVYWAASIKEHFSDYQPLRLLSTIKLILIVQKSEKKSNL